MSEVAIDLSDILSHFSGPEPESVAYLVTSLRSDGGEACKKLADQIEAKYAPPRIPEPGPWGVVEASTADNSKRRDFGRVPDEVEGKQWTSSFDDGWYDWPDLVGPVLIREGLS